MYSANGDGAKLTCSETFNAYGIWLLIDDNSDEITPIKIVGYAKDGSEKYSLNIDKDNFNLSYSYLTLNWIDIKSIQFTSTTNGETPTSSILYDELDYRPFSQIPTLLTPK